MPANWSWQGEDMLLRDFPDEERIRAAIEGYNANPLRDHELVKMDPINAWDLDSKIGIRPQRTGSAGQAEDNLPWFAQRPVPQGQDTPAAPAKSLSSDCA